MKTAAETNANQTKLRLAEAAWTAVLNEALQRGFHGVVSLELSVQDGSIQYVKRRLERLDR